MLPLHGLGMVRLELSCSMRSIFLLLARCYGHFVTLWAQAGHQAALLRLCVLVWLAGARLHARR